MKPNQRQHIGAFIVGTVFSLTSLYMALAIHYWLGWPKWIRDIDAWLFPIAMLGMWFFAGPYLRTRRLIAASILAILAIAYFTKSPVEQTWVPLQSRHATAVIDGDKITISNFRDAVHTSGKPSNPVWTTQTFKLSELEGADLIIQPFGNVKALAHMMLSFRFADGRAVVVSMEARQAAGGKFDALAGFFRHDQLYPELATERDLFWERLSRVPPDNLQIYPIRKSPEVLRIFLKRILVFSNTVAERPKFYSTLSESCMTAFINLVPESFASVPFYDLRRWIPGYSLSLFQQLGLVDDSAPAEDLARTHALRPGLRSPAEFPSEQAWSAYIRQ